MEKETKTRIKTRKAYSSARDNTARWPKKNVSDVAPEALVNTFEEDEFTHLVLAAPTVDITNLDTSKITTSDNTEVYKQMVVESCQNMFKVAENAISRHPKLKKVVIMEHAPRHDVAQVDPTKLKPKLAKYANSVLTEMLLSSDAKDLIMIGKHSLDISEDMVDTVFRDDWTGRFDGVHMYNGRGASLYTKSVVQIFKALLSPHQMESNGSTSSPSSSFHDACPQAQYQERQRKKQSQMNNDRYSIPVRNQFDILGN